MTSSYKFGRPIPERLMTQEEPGKPLLFDADPGLVDEVTTRFNVESLVTGLPDHDGASARAAFEKFGRELMIEVMGLVDGKYLDRTGQVIEKVAQMTGVSFPHRFERYVELSLLGSRPTDRWNITKATTKELVLQVSACAVNKAVQAAGLNYQDLPCAGLCLASFQAAADKTGDRVKMELARKLPQDGVCQFHFSI